MVRSKEAGRPKSIDELVGARLRSAREAISETPATIAQVMGVSVEAYERMECGEERPAPEALHLASLLLRVPITYFFTGFSAEHSAAASADEECAPKPTEGKH
jgi:transcriptional regulator with XRE-family HTH domain